MPHALSVLIPAKNERHNLPACLDSLEDLPDEVVLADSGSTDGTIEYARSRGCRVIEREYVTSGDFKNWAIPQCRNERVLLLDADERLTPALAAEIRRLLAQPDLLDGYWIYRRSFFLGKPLRYGGCHRDKVLRLFHRDRARYVGETDHAEIDLPPHRTGTLRNRMEHHTCPSLDDYFRKFLRYTSQNAEVRFAKGRRTHAARLLLTVPFKFLNLYFRRWGFLDGIPGLIFCVLSAFSSFTTQARMWELEHVSSSNSAQSSVPPSAVPLTRRDAA